MSINNGGMREVILRLVKADPKLADDDKKLIATVWWNEGWRDERLYEMLKLVSSPETIRRTRAKLVEEGKIKPSEKTTDARYNKWRETRDNLGYE